MLKPIHIRQGLKYFFYSWRGKLRGIKEYKGNASEICQQIVEDCWNGDYFQTSAGHFNGFWMRDFGWCVESLLKLGYKKRVVRSLEYALEKFKKRDQVTTTITTWGNGFDFPYYATDSLPFLLYSLRLGGAVELVKENIDFLNQEIKKYYQKVIDKKSGLVKSDRNFSSIKDYAKRKSSCYSNCMVGMLKKEISELNKKLGKRLVNPFSKWDYEKIILENFFNGEYFYDDLNKVEVVSADANLFPFWTGVIKNKKIMRKCLAAIQKEKLDEPFPVKFSQDYPEEKMIFLEFLVKDYETDSVWTHLGPMLVQLMDKIDKKKARAYKRQYKKLIENNRNYLEVFNVRGERFKRLFYMSDEGMLWAVNYLTLER